VDNTYDFTFEFTGSDESSARALSSLYRWLREDVAVRNEAKVEFAADAGPEQMGAADVLTAVLTQLTAIGSLAVAVATWRDSRAAAPLMRIRFGSATIEVTDATDDQLAAALHALVSTHEQSSSTVDVAASGVPDEVPDGEGPRPSRDSSQPEA